MRPLTLMWGSTPRLIQFETVRTVTFSSSATCALVKSRLRSVDSSVFIFTAVLSAALIDSRLPAQRGFGSGCKFRKARDGVEEQ